MIKRDGIEIMNARAGNVNIARETIEIVKQGKYVAPSGKEVSIAAETEAAIQGTIFYREPLPKKDYTAIVPIIEVINEKTDQAAIRLAASGKTDIVALNFAAARNVGGGFLSGAKAQEEDLCRASSLYACLKSKPMFYNDNLLCEDSLYTHNALYSPKVPFIRDEKNELLEEPFTLSIITCPAPNLIGLRTEGMTDLLTGLLRERAMKVLEIAEANSHTNLILGAWGCGAFCNDPLMVANAFKFAMEKVPAFEHIAFAVYDAREGTPLFHTFQDAFTSIFLA